MYTKYPPQPALHLGTSTRLISKFACYVIASFCAVSVIDATVCAQWRNKCKAYLSTRSEQAFKLQARMGHCNARSEKPMQCLIFWTDGKACKLYARRQMNHLTHPKPFFLILGLHTKHEQSILIVYLLQYLMLPSFTKICC